MTSQLKSIEKTLSNLEVLCRLKQQENQLLSLKSALEKKLESVSAPAADKTKLHTELSKLKNVHESLGNKARSVCAFTVGTLVRPIPFESSSMEALTKLKQQVLAYKAAFLLRTPAVVVVAPPQSSPPLPVKPNVVVASSPPIGRSDRRCCLDNPNKSQGNDQRQ